MLQPERLAFFLGGQDLEMLTIREIVCEVAPERLYNKHLSWGAKASSYQREIATALDQELIPVLVELANDIALPAEQCYIVDHHGEHAGADQPTSLQQVFALLKLPPQRWTRWLALVAANDRGYIPALIELGASQAEIADIRAADRKAQGITQAEEDAAAVAMAQATAVGPFTIVHLPHTHTATVTDLMHPALGGPGDTNLVIYCPDQVHFFGSGALIQALDTAFPGGWYGGALPQQGFWGHETPALDILPVLLAAESRQRKRAHVWERSSTN